MKSLYHLKKKTVDSFQVSSVRDKKYIELVNASKMDLNVGIFPEN